MKKTLAITILTLSTALGSSPAAAQEVAVVDNNDSNDALPIAQLKNLVESLGASFNTLQNNFSILENDLSNTQNELSLVQACNAKFMIYNPASATADSDGCTSTAPTNVTLNGSCIQEGAVSLDPVSKQLLTCVGGKWISTSSVTSLKNLFKVHAGKTVSCATSSRSGNQSASFRGRARVLSDGTPQLYIPSTDRRGYIRGYKWITALYSHGRYRLGNHWYTYELSLERLSVNITGSHNFGGSDNRSDQAYNNGCTAYWPIN